MWQKYTLLRALASETWANLRYQISPLEDEIIAYVVSPTDTVAQTSLFKRFSALQYALATTGSPAYQREKPKAGTSDKNISPDSATQKD